MKNAKLGNNLLSLTATDGKGYHDRKENKIKGTRNNLFFHFLHLEVSMEKASMTRNKNIAKDSPYLSLVRNHGRIFSSYISLISSQPVKRP